MGKDKFGTKRGRCGACEECYEYIAPSDGKLACDYCDHKPIYHTEVVALGSCSCGNCAGYESSNECQYNACDYCDCSAEKHIGYNKVQAEIDKVKQRLLETRTGQVSHPKSIESTVQPLQQVDAQRQESAIYVSHSHPPGVYSQPSSIPGQPQFGIQMPSSVPNPMQQFSPQQPQQPKQLPYGSQMAQNPIPTQQHYPLQQPYGPQMYNMQPNPMPRAYSPENPFHSYGQAPMQHAPMQPVPMQQAPMQQSPMQQAPPFRMPFSPTGAGPGIPSGPYESGVGAGNFFANICKNPNCKKPRRAKEDNSGLYDYCGRRCASQAK